jgi:hypothetical protein
VEGTPAGRPLGQAIVRFYRNSDRSLAKTRTNPTSARTRPHLLAMTLELRSKTHPTPHATLAANPVRCSIREFTKPAQRARRMRCIRLFTCQRAGPKRLTKPPNFRGPRTLRATLKRPKKRSTPEPGKHTTHSLGVNVTNAYFLSFFDPPPVDHD